MGRTDLTETQWRNLHPHLPGNPPRGHAYADHRRVINGILWRLKTGATWRDIPERYGPWQTCFDRFVRWSRDGTWQRILTALQVQHDAQGNIDWDGAAADSTHIKAHRSATGARKTSARLEKGLDSWGVARREPRWPHQQNPRTHRWKRASVGRAGLRRTGERPDLSRTAAGYRACSARRQGSTS